MLVGVDDRVPAKVPPGVSGKGEGGGEGACHACSGSWLWTHHRFCRSLSTYGAYIECVLSFVRCRQPSITDLTFSTMSVTGVGGGAPAPSAPEMESAMSARERRMMPC